jgi:hypothetical protein
MPLTKHHDVVKAFPSDRSDQPLTIAILPWRLRRGRPIPNTHRSKAVGTENLNTDVLVMKPVCVSKTQARTSW